MLMSDDVMGDEIEHTCRAFERAACYIQLNDTPSNVVAAFSFDQVASNEAISQVYTKPEKCKSHIRSR